MDLLCKLERHFDSEIKLMQFVIDSNWEQAWVIEKDNIPPNISQIDSLLQNQFENIACEVFFEDITNKQMFFGLKYLKDRNHFLECYQFIYKLCVALSAKNFKLSELIEQISWQLEKVPLFSKEPSYLELGVVNYWQSDGSVRLWEQGQPKQLSEADIEAKLQNNKQLIGSDKNYQAIEFAFEGEYPHWLGIQIGEKKNGMYEANISSIVDLAEELFGFKSPVA